MESHTIGLAETINTQIADTGRKVSVGQAVQAMILNGLGFANRALYLSPEFFHNKPVELLVGEGIEAPDLNDDCLGRALGDLREDEAMLEQIRQTHGKYIVTTNELDEHKLAWLEMLAIYKTQSSSVEGEFRFLKDPIFFADSLFLKKLACIMALLIYALAEHQVRIQLLDHNQTLPDQTGNRHRNPLFVVFFQMMEGIDILIINQAGFRQHLLLNMTDIRWQIINLSMSRNYTTSKFRVRNVHYKG